MTQVEAAGPGSLGWGPSAERFQAGQLLFTGRVTAGPWLGHDVVIEVDPREEPRRSRRRRRASPEPIEPFGFEVSLVDRQPSPAQAASAMPGDPFAWLDDLTSLDEYLDPMRVEWFTPTEAAHAWMRMYRVDER